MSSKSPALSVGEVVRLLESHAPSSTAEAWDNVGLLAGDPSWSTSGAVVAIDLTEEALQEAKRRKVRLIINHHPCIFPKSKGLLRVIGGPGKSGLVFEAIREGIAIAAYHTNFDRCALEVAEVISSELGLVPKGRLFDKPQGSLMKLCVYVPSTHLGAVRRAVTEAGAGQIGNYDSCTFGVEGEGTFRGSRGTRPFLGKPGRLESAKEVRLETILPRGLEKQVVHAMMSAHPYEETAYDLYPIEQSPRPVGLVKGLGYGFWGEFSKPKAFSELLKDVRRTFNVEGFLLTEPAPKSIRRLAFAAGKGASVVEAAASAGCDLMITGEAGYHEAIGASKYGQMAVLELGHRESERFFVEIVRGWLAEAGLRATGLHVKTQKFWRA